MAESDQDHLVNHLRDTHALEQQSIRQLERSQHMSRAPDMEEIYREHLEQTREHERMIRERLKARDLKPSAVKDLTTRPLRFTVTSPYMLAKTLLDRHYDDRRALAMDLAEGPRHGHPMVCCQQCGPGL